jgi:NADH-quinone oxidoreductase subunit J
MLSMISSSPIEWILACVLIASAFGTILLRQPVHACLSFLLTLLSLATFYVQLSAPFIGVMQILVYAGAIMVIFMFVIVLFQDAHAKIHLLKELSAPLLIYVALAATVIALGFLGNAFIGFEPALRPLPKGYGTVQSLGQVIYTDFFFPFEAIIVLFLVAVMGALYIARREKR